MSVFEKLDTGLIMALRAFEACPDAHDTNSGISVSLRFEGDLAALEALGFETHSASRGEALGVVQFKDIEALVAHPGVLWMAAGRARKIDLDKSVSDIRARASTSANVGTDGLWHAVVASGALNQAGNATGAGVIVAVIDTGIDFTHPMFMSQITPTKKTRILRIWDQGLLPSLITDCPDKVLLDSTDTYGVEYDNNEIDAALNGGTPVLHRDCRGHGTHVTAIAAGGVTFPAGGDAAKVGVAPEADIIAVKMLDTPEPVKYRLAASFGADVGFPARFHDAVLYCLRTAQALTKPVVINMSFSNTAEAGDGLDDDARWLDERMDPGQSAGPLNFPKGAVVVTSMGNTGDPTFRQVARITVPAGGQVTVPLKLTDTRGALQTTWQACARTVFKPPIGVSFWYRRANPFTSVKFALRLPHGSPFSGDMGVGGHLERGFVPRTTPPSVAFVTPADNVHSAFVLHEGNPAVPHPGGSVRRHLVSFWITPKQSGGTVSYYPETYEMRIKVDAGTTPTPTEIFAMCDQVGWAAGKFVMFEIGTTLQDGTALDPGIVISSEMSAADPLGQHVISVAAYNDTDGNAADADRHAIASFSSRGPFRDFSDPPGSLPPIATKPDIAAPGVNISAAESAESDAPPIFRSPAWIAGRRFIDKNGTSMSAPMIAGVVALMLDKKGDLSTTEVRNILTAAAAGRPGVNPAAPSVAHTNAYGSGMVDALPSHVNTP